MWSSPAHEEAPDDHTYRVPGYVANLVSQGSRRAAEVARHAAAAISPIMAPYQPVVVFLAAMTPARSR
jgi:hypothetical protein